MQSFFADHVLDTGVREPRCGSEPVAVEPQALYLLGLTGAVPCTAVLYAKSQANLQKKSSSA
jgi:hypothetical protein